MNSGLNTRPSTTEPTAGSGPFPLRCGSRRPCCRRSVTKEVRINAFRMISVNTYVPTMNRNERNEYTVRDGILLSTGRKMPPLRRRDGQETS